MVNKKLLTILAGAAVSFPVIGSSQLGEIQHVKHAVTAASNGEVIAHTVKPGENLWRIAKDHGFTEQEIMDFNRLPNSVIRPGQVIRMPRRPLPHANDSIVTNTPAPVAMGGTYTVKGGDVLARIARFHGVSVDALMAANGIKDATKLRIGQQLKVPGAAAPAPVAPTASTPPRVASSSTMHTVRKGDTLFGIASKHRVSIAQIKSANSLSSEQLQIGQSLTIPGSAVASSGQVIPASSSAPAQPKVSDLGHYTVLKGDTFSKIARTFGTTTTELIRINQITNPNVLVPGQTLIVPGGSQAAPAPTHAGHDHGNHGSHAAATPTAPAATPPTAPAIPEELPDPSPVRSGGVQDYAGYTIVPGDTLETIAQTFATTKAELMRLNKLSAPDEVKSGDQILVPTYGIYNDLGGPY